VATSPDDEDYRALLQQAVFSPPADVWTTARKVVISVEIPGVLEEAVSVDAGDGAVTVRGRRAAHAGGLDWHRLERTFGEFHCHFALPLGADPSRRSVSLRNGVLTVEIPRNP
jgi:HSP20 family protein